MSILISKETKVIIQGITGSRGSMEAKLMKSYGTKVVAGVTPGKKGKNVSGIPVYNSVKEALAEHPASWSCLFVPAPYAKNAAIEALENGLNIVIITEHMPVHDTLEVINFAKKKNLIVIGPNCPGIVTAGECNISIIPDYLFKKGKVGVISRSGTLTYEFVNLLTQNKIGQSTVVGIGGDPVVGMDIVDVLEMFEHDDGTEKIVLVGEIGGDAEETAAEYIKQMKKKVVAFIAGKTAPPGKTMGHAGALISGKSGTAETKIKALKEAGVEVAEVPADIVKLLKG